MRSISRTSIKTQILLLSGVVILALLFVLATMFSNANKVVAKARKEEAAILHRQYENRLALTSENFYVLLNTLRYSSQIHRQLFTKDSLHFSSMAIQTKNDMQYFKAANPWIKDVLLQGGGHAIYTTMRLKHVPDDFVIEDASHFKYSRAYFDMTSYPGAEAPIFLIGCRIPYTSAGISSTRDGSVILSVSGKALALGWPDAKPQYDGLYYYLIDNAGVVFDSNEPESIGKQGIAQDGSVLLQDLHGSTKSEYTNVQKFQHFGVTLVSVLDSYSLIKATYAAFPSMFALTFLLFALILMNNAFLLLNVLKPMRSIGAVVNKINLGDLNSLSFRANTDGFLELRVLAGKFNDMLNRIQTLQSSLIHSTREMHELEIRQTESELNYLRSQIDPHFLCNTLETIRGMAAMEKSSNIHDVVNSLISIFRYSLRGKMTVTLDEELQIIQSYLQIQSVRFGDRISIDYCIDPEARTCLIPKMVLQPIIENAVKHGIEPSPSPHGKITVRASVTNKRLAVAIHDNGAGMTKEELEAVRQKLSGQEENASASIGLINVHDRLRLLYKEDLRFYINSKQNYGTAVRFIIPERRDLREEDSGHHR